ncbi:MAG: hypothetical protein RI564_11550 [Gracilimonas sp.]|nr:hypothetical protein [Gracilimonas sp.]
MLLKNNYMWKKFILIILLIPYLSMNCTTNSGKESSIEINGEWQLQGVEQLEINNINSKINPLLISTSSGIYTLEEGDFSEFGLQDKPIVNITHIKENTYLAAIETFHLENGDTTLYKTDDSGQTWTSHMNNYGGSDNKYTMITDLQIKESGSSVIFACGGGNIARTTDEGSTWESVFLTWEHLGKAIFVKSDIYNPNIIWAGGENAIFQPTLIKSEDGGDSWDRIKIYENIEAANNDIIINQKDAKNLLIGLSGSVASANKIRRSLDDGETWDTVFEGASIHTFTHSASNPEIVYASGRNPEGRLFFLASNNFGDTWQTIEHPESPSNIYVNDMVSVTEEGQEVIYLGTNKGLYSFTVQSY